jgi:gas vesicle protein
MSNENQTGISNFVSGLTGLLIGSLAGAVTMFFLAPRSGAKSRKQIQEKSIELREQASEMIDDVMKKARSEGKKFSKNGSHKAQKLMHTSQEFVNDQLEHVTEVVKAGKKAILNT